MPANSNAASKKSQGNLSKKSQSKLSRRSQRFEVDEEIATKEFFVTKRYCRDVIFLLLFAAFWFGMILVAMNAFRTGDPKRIVIPQDYLGNYCGIDNTNSSLVVANAYSNQTANPYLYYFSIQDLTNATHICVKECPKETKALSVSNYLCRYDITPTILNYATLVQKFHCAAYTLASSPILNRCIPGVSSSTDNSTTSSNDILSQSRDFAVRVLSDLQVTWKIAVGAGVSMILSFIWMLLLQYLAGLIVWVCIIGCNIFFVFGSIWLYLYWQANLALLNQTTITGIQAQINSIVGINDSTTVFVSKSNTDVLQWTFIVMAVIGVLLLLITIGMFKRVVIAVGVIKQASLAMKKMPLISMTLSH
ncbi:hypothetical protein HDV02_000204 [Globomyces sp. JEL0801]|nr:hypothetical protein HDV02_000204 [Globomyces sp. JEL0801]